MMQKTKLRKETNADESPLEAGVDVRNTVIEACLEKVLCTCKNICSARLECLQKFAVLFKILSTDHSLSSVLPYRYRGVSVHFNS